MISSCHKNGRPSVSLFAVTLSDLLFSCPHFVSAMLCFQEGLHIVPKYPFIQKVEQYPSEKQAEEKSSEVSRTKAVKALSTTSVNNNNNNNNNSNPPCG